ncbi:MAG TPA: DUF6125 family protein [Chitinivibrionales bacterium]|nr:DUF6125 family protein [Chitinivibrionales bacterium]
MFNLSPDQIIDYFKKSYAAVDGLWFMKTEDADGFDKALDVDEKVWQIMPKIQARKMKSFSKMDWGIDALRECFEAKLSLDGFVFTTVNNGSFFDINVSECPWYDKLVQSNRANLAEKIGSRICTAEYSGWANEFGCSFSFLGEDRICRECKSCSMRFSEK